MTHTAAAVLAATTAELSPDPARNAFVAEVEQGTARQIAISTLTLEQRHVIPSDRRAFAHLAERAAALGAPASAAFFATLAEGERTAADHLAPLAAACGLDAAAIDAYEPLPGCQAYPSYVARLALTGHPAEVVLALSANFAAWGDSCARIGHGLRGHYGYDDDSCAFFDFFAAPAPALAEQAEAAVQEGLDGVDGLDVSAACRSGRLLQSYERLFWDTLAGLA
ncbi:thiaminase II/PqqC family protein [Streptomyces luteolus]|uniref:Transcriptional regulator n=1 Tax=Streptomyces luteolus TaxID=3043615 RepID=A0ABT6SWY6_9ACTN|nr:transcriptional regulator [Streptomyces sp. B-S-A12]MDI3419364.1 transcriptional regulator [Streptomyces sp. B-S-A12]